MESSVRGSHVRISEAQLRVIVLIDPWLIGLEAHSQKDLSSSKSLDLEDAPPQV